MRGRVATPLVGTCPQGTFTHRALADELVDLKSSRQLVRRSAPAGPGVELISGERPHRDDGASLRRSRASARPMSYLDVTVAALDDGLEPLALVATTVTEYFTPLVRPEMTQCRAAGVVAVDAVEQVNEPGMAVAV